MTRLRGMLAVLAAVLAIGLGLAALALGASAVATALIANRVEQDHPPVGSFVEVGGGRLAFLEAFGEGVPRGTVVLLHGASANASDPMEGFGRKLAAKGFRVIAFDRPGFGWSDRLAGDAAASLAFQAKAIGEALDRMRIDRAIVYGHSWAGALALRIALDRPDRVSALVLAAPVAMPFAQQPSSWWLRLALYPPMTKLLIATVGVPIGRYYLQRAAHGVFLPEAMPADYVERSRAELILRPGPGLANIQDLVALPEGLSEQAPRYTELRLPTVIVAGDADRVVTTGVQTEFLSRRIEGAKLVTLPGVGHMLHYTAADRIVAEIAALQDRVDAR